MVPWYTHKGHEGKNNALFTIICTHNESHQKFPVPRVSIHAELAAARREASRSMPFILAPTDRVAAGWNVAWKSLF